MPDGGDAPDGEAADAETSRKSGPTAGAAGGDSTSSAGAGGSVSSAATAGAAGAAGADAAANSCMAEACDNVDNDCDGKIDEAVSRPCGPPMALGACRPGTETCSAGTWSECVGAVVAQLEVCEAGGLDENCDGAVNEGCGCTTGALQPCGDGDGTCKQGMQTCVDGQWDSECVGMVGPTKESCDAQMVDEDCDGIPNQNCECVEGAEETCQGNSTGQCAPGTRTCANGRWSPCTGAIAPKSESCDMVDNDCDDAVDEDSCANGQRCVSGRCAECSSDTDCSAMDDDCNEGTCESGSCRPTPKMRGTACERGLCDRGTCHEVECFSASDCSDSDARCTDGVCEVCGDRKIGPGEQCDIGAPKKTEDLLRTATYDEYSCDAQTCRRLYVFTPCTVDTMTAGSSECGGDRCINGQVCVSNAGCDGPGACTLANDKPGTCYGNACFLSCSTSTDCPSGMPCQEASGIGKICSP